MKTKQIQTGPLCFLVIALSARFFFTSQANAASALAGADAPPSKSAEAVAWSQIAVRAGADYKGDGLAVAPTESGAQLRCLFQRLEGEATTEGLWLRSTLTNTMSERFRVVASSVGRGTQVMRDAVRQALPGTGTVEVTEKLVRFIRAGMVEEYAVSMDGLRQDFIVEQRPEGDGELCVELAVTGAKVEQTAYGTQLVLEESGRKIAYDRLRVNDATGKELQARMEVASARAFTPASTSATLALLVEDALAVFPIRIDPTFSDANWISMGGIRGADRVVYATVVDDSGNLYIGGNFTVVGDIIANYIAKWNGSSWSALGAGLSSDVSALAVSGSDLYAGGSFFAAGGRAASRIAKWNGTSWSALGSGMNSYVWALGTSGSDLYAGGAFTNAGGVAANRVAKWNGNSWSALGSGMNNTVSALAISGSEVYAGGYFTNAGGTAANYIAKWNGSSWSALASGMRGSDGFNPSAVHALAASGSNLYAAGNFTMAGGVTANYIAKWNGSSWSALGSRMSFWPTALAVSGSDVYAGGYFKEADGVAANYIAKWNGSSWSALGSGMNDWVRALTMSGSNLYAGGYFTTAGGSAASGIAKWNGNGWGALGTGMNSNVHALAVSGSNLYVGGNFTTAGGIAANYIAQWDGSTWNALGSGVDLGDGFNPPGVRALATSGSAVYTGGIFRNAGWSVANHIAKWNGSYWSALGSGVGGFGYVRALAAVGSELYTGGSFTTLNGGPGQYIAKWNGNSWSPLGSGMNGPVYALAVMGSDLYAGGSFTIAGDDTNQLKNSVAKWNGDTWSALGSGMNSTVYALAVAGSNVYAGGDFTTAGGVAADRVAKWNGSSWSALGSGTDSTVYALAVSGSDLYAGGNFTTAGGHFASYIAKWDGSNWTAMGSGMNRTVEALAVSGSNLYAGGGFTSAGGKVSAYMARAALGDAPGYNELAGTPLSGGAMQFSYIGYPATNYALDRTFNLAPPISWIGQRTNTMTVSGVLMFTNTPVTTTNNFWRVRSLP